MASLFGNICEWWFTENQASQKRPFAVWGFDLIQACKYTCIEFYHGSVFVCFTADLTNQFMLLTQPPGLILCYHTCIMLMHAATVNLANWWWDIFVLFDIDIWMDEDYHPAAHEVKHENKLRIYATNIMLCYGHSKSNLSFWSHLNPKQHAGGRIMGTSRLFNLSN